MEDNIKFGNHIVTLGNDISKKCSICLQNINNIKCIVIYKKDNNGYSSFSEDDFIAAISIDQISSLSQKILNYL